VADSCVYFNDQSLSYTFGNPRSQFGGGDEMAPGNLHPEIQSSPWTSGASISEGGDVVDKRK